MFTIKHQHQNGESLHEGSEPMYMPAVDNGTTGRIGSLAYTNRNGVIITLEGGEVYVMNDQGKTVAKYNLDGHPLASAPPIR